VDYISSATAHAPTAEQPRDRRRWLALVVLCLAQFMVILDITVVNVALPVIGEQLALDRAELTWVVTAYTLCFGGLMLLGGRLADTLGRRRTFLVGLGLFTLASLGSGLAADGTALVIARAAQGVGAALLSPSALSIITTTFHGPDRNRALGVWAAIGGSGAAIGVLLGGALVSGPGWPWVFFLNLPVGVAVAMATPLVIRAGRPREAAGRVDLAGALVITTAVALLIFGLVEAGDAGWSTAPTLAPLAAGLALLGVFARIERAVRSPLVRLEALTRRPVVAGMLTMLAASALLLSAFFLSSLYLQRVLGSTALATGLSFLPIALAIILGAQVSAATLGRLGPRAIAAAGFALAAAGTGLLARLPADGHVLVDVLPGFGLAAVGLGATFVAATTTAMTHVEPSQAGMTSGLINTSHELGAALGVALVSTIAGASIDAGATGPVPVDGFGNAFLASALVAALMATTALWLLPAGRPPAAHGPAFAH
jgi:EmrB/QacA subfamily drug resistance transporter